MALDKSLKIALVLTAVDKASEVIRKVDKSAKQAFSLGKNTAVAGIALAAPIIYATKKAIEFEDVMADVAKVYNTKIGDSEFLRLGEQAKDLSVYLSKSAEDSAALMAALGQGGVGKSELNEVAKVAGQMAVAFDLTAEIAGDRYTKLKNALNSSWADTAKLGDAINYLSDNQASKASEILEYMASGGAGVAKMSKSAGKDIAAMGSYLLSVGKSGSESATIMDRFYKGIMKTSSARQLFTKAGEGAEGFLAVLKAGQNIKDPTAQFKYFKQFGEYGSEIRAMALNYDQVKDSISSVGNELNFTGSVKREFLNRNSTTSGQMKKSFAEFNRVVLDFGTNGLPVITSLLAKITPLINSIGQFMKNNQKLSETLFMVVAGSAAFSIAVSALSFTFGGFLKVISLTTATFKWLRLGQLAYITATAAGATVTGGFTAAMAALNLAFLANPITWIVLGVVALVAGFVIAYQRCDKFRATIHGLVSVGKILYNVFSAVSKLIIGTFTFNTKKMLEGAQEAASLTKLIANGGISNAFNQAYNKSLPSTKTSLPSLPKSDFSKGNKAGTTLNFSPVINVSGGATKADGEQINQSVKSQFEQMMRGYNDKNKRLAF